MSWHQTLLAKASNYRFAIMIAAAVMVTAILTSISITVYIASGAINIDLSRPGFETVRQDIEDNSETAPFSPTGPIDQSTIDDFNQRLENIKTDLNQMNDFSVEAISDQALNLE
jgi:hypothetical protein